MDELNMIRSMLDDGLPSQAVVIDGRRRLQAAQVPVRPKRRVRLRLAGVGLGAVAAAAAVAVVATSGAPVDHRPVAGGPVTARQILLTAATQAEQAVSGRYWHSHTIIGQGYPVSGGYSILGARMEIDQWTASRPADDNVYFSRFAGAIPETASDQAAWKRAGSPSKWTVFSGGHYIPQTTQPAAWDRSVLTPAQRAAMAKPMKNGCRQQCPGMTMTEQQGKALAADPQKLSALVFPTTGKGGKSVTSGDIMSAFGFLAGQPVSADVRAEVFRLLAKVPGIRAIGHVKDSEGRTAVALAAPSQDGDTAVDTELLLDPASYQILGTQDVVVQAGPEFRGMKVGSIFTNQVVVSVGWTNEVPHHG